MSIFSNQYRNEILRLNREYASLIKKADEAKEAKEKLFAKAIENAPFKTGDLVEVVYGEPRERSTVFVSRVWLDYEGNYQFDFSAQTKNKSVSKRRGHNISSTVKLKVFSITQVKVKQDAT